MCTQVWLILILISVQYLQNVVFGFEKGSIGQNSSSSDSHHPIKKCPCSKVSHYPPTEGIPPPQKKNYLENAVYSLYECKYHLKLTCL